MLPVFGEESHQDKLNALELKRKELLIKQEELAIQQQEMKLLEEKSRLAGQIFSATNLPVVVKAVVETNGLVCSVCRGGKTLTINKEASCVYCKGSKIEHTDYYYRRHFDRGACHYCFGTGLKTEKVAVSCLFCSGTGRTTKEELGNIVRCPSCRGMKEAELSVFVNCQRCGGRGDVEPTFNTPRYGSLVQCKFCRGVGYSEKKAKHVCPDCDGLGITKK